MGKLTYILTILFACCVLHVAAADTTLHIKPIQSIKGEYVNVAVDNIGNIFLINPNNQLKKTNEKSDSLGVFNDIKRYGNIHSVDVSNPLKVLVFYKDFATVVVLDRLLNTRNTIDLRQSNIIQASAIAQSYDNNVWVYDELDNKIKKVDDNGRVLSQSVDFRMLFDDVPVPTHMIDMNGLLYLYNPQYGWLTFDYYGALKNKYPFAAWKDVQVFDKTLIGRDSSYFYAYDFSQIKFARVKPDTDLSHVIKVINTPGRCYILRKESLDIYEAP